MATKSSSPSLFTSPLTINQLIDVLDLLKRCGFPQTRWHELGLRLGLHKNTLDAIGKNHPGDVARCLTETLSKWLSRADNVDTKGGATFDSLSDALKFMNENAAAVKLDQEITTSSGSSTASTSQTRRKTEEGVTYNPDQAHEVMTENALLIKGCGIDLNFLIDKLLEHKIINARKKKEVTDGYCGKTEGERIDELLQIISSSIELDGEVFGIFIDILRKENTRNTIAVANKLMEKYKLKMK
uniref:Death domain-containing protein n=1 Tax=Amphimedon queenslandica TaxID=400682 RepID=A0A1X7T908_AMPQE